MKTEEVTLKDLKVLNKIEKAYAKTPENATTMELLEAIAKATGESLSVVHKRFTDIKGKK